MGIQHGLSRLGPSLPFSKEQEYMKKGASCMKLLTKAKSTACSGAGGKASSFPTCMSLGKARPAVGPGI